MSDPNQFNMDDFTAKSEEYYNTIKTDLETRFKGKYAALDYSSKRFWTGNTASDALELAKKEQPNRLFYVVLVGAPTTFIIQSVLRSDGVGSGSALYGHRRVD